MIPLNSNLITPVSVTGVSLSLTVLTIGGIVYLHSRTRKLAGLFAAICGTVFLWIFASSIFSGMVVDSTQATVWARVATACPVVFAALLVLFSFSFPVQIRKLSWFQIGLILLPGVAVLPAAFTPLNLSVSLVGSTDLAVSRGVAFYLLLSIAVAYVISAFGNFIVAWRRAEGDSARKQATFAVAGLVAMAVISLGSHFVLPVFFGPSFSAVSPFSPIGAAFFLVFMAHTVIRDQVLDLRIMAAELFAIILVVVNMIELMMADGRDRLALRAFLLLASAATGILLIRGVTAEVRRRLQLQRLAIRLDRMNQELRQLDEAKSEFISIASHQLRTPVSVIKGYLSLIKEGVFGPVKGELRDKLEQIYDMNERLVHLINNLLNVSRIEQDTAQFWCSEVSVVEIARRVVGNMEDQIKGKNLVMSFEEPTAGVPNVFVDPERLTEIVTNLVDNAIKYTSQGNITVRVLGSDSDSTVTVQVEDTGTGMDPEDMRHVFQKFYRPRRPTDEHRSGLNLGLGLYICARFLRSMGGDIWVERTVPGKGTTIAFSLPVQARGVCRYSEDGNSVSPRRPKGKKIGPL